MRTCSIIRILLLGATVLAFAEGLAVGQTTNVNFLPTGPATWNLNGNWDPVDNGGVLPQGSVYQNGGI